jgi:hypothetical protein
MAVYRHWLLYRLADLGGDRQLHHKGLMQRQRRVLVTP